MTSSTSANGRATFRHVVVGLVLVVLVGALLVFRLRSPSDSAPSEATIVRIATGLENPRGVAVLPDGRLVVVEAGNGIDTPDRTLETGRVSLLEDLNNDGDHDDAGEIVPVTSPIPSYNTLTEFGTGHDEVGGAGDIVLLDDGRMFLTRDDPSEAYVPDGNPAGINVVELSPDFRLGNNLVVRNATMNAVAFDSQADVFYIVESGSNRVIAVTMDGTIRTVADFAPLAQGQQAVPSGLAIDPTTGDLLVALFSGQVDDYFGEVLSFMPGDSRIVRVNPTTGAQAVAIEGLTTAVDVAADEMGNAFVVELTSQWPPPRMSRDFDLFDPNAVPDPGGYARFAGSVTMYPADGSRSVPLVDGLDSPTNITYADGALYVSIGQGTPGRSIIGPAGLTRIVGEIYRISDFLP